MLVGLLWCLALLSVVVIGLLHTASLDLRIQKNSGDMIQAHYLALAGIEKAKALLYQDGIQRRRAAQNHSGELYDSPRDFRDVPLGRGQFSIFHQGTGDRAGETVFGVTDEESRLNVNQVTADELGKLYQMTPDIVAATIDFRDEDNAVTPGGAEADYYASLQPPYLPRNAPFQSLRELLMVRGMTRELLFGEDANQNGLLDPGEDDGAASDPPDNQDGVLDAGWAASLTVNSAVQTTSASGSDRANPQLADEATLAGIKGITTDIAKAIVAWRNQNRIQSLADLLEVRAMTQNAPPVPQPASGPGGAFRPGRVSVPQGAPGQPQQQQAQPTGPPLINEQLLMDIADDLTTVEGKEQAGAVNINTASLEVLACLPGLNRELAQAVISQRQSSGFFPNIAWLLKVPGFTREIFKQLAPRVTARSETFRILSEGRIQSTGARKRIEAVVRLEPTVIHTLSYREDDL